MKRLGPAALLLSLCMATTAAAQELMLRVPHAELSLQSMPQTWQRAASGRAPLPVALWRIDTPMRFHTDRSDVGGAALSLMATYAPRVVKAMNGPWLVVPTFSRETVGGAVWAHF